MKGISSSVEGDMAGGIVRSVTKVSHISSHTQAHSMHTHSMRTASPVTHRRRSKARLNALPSPPPPPPPPACTSPGSGLRRASHTHTHTSAVSASLVEAVGQAVITRACGRVGERV